HAALTLRGIRSHLGSGLHLRRAGLVDHAFEQLEEARVLVVSGPAGSGKSAVAKEVTGILAEDHLVFAFRAEEFAKPHLDATLHAAQVPASASQLAALLAGQARKTILVESVERLLEAATRDAFTDLLSLIAADKSWRLLLTCRDYSAELVRTVFLQAAGLDH